MPLGAKYVFMVSMDVAPEKEALFNEVYDREHIPNLLAVPGVLGVSRVKSQPFAVSIGGERKEMPAGNPFYTAIYELENPEVLERRLGAGGRGWPMARRGAPIHEQPPPCAGPGDLIRPASPHSAAATGCAP